LCIGGGTANLSAIFRGYRDRQTVTLNPFHADLAGAAGGP